MASINLLDEDLLIWNRFRAGDADAFGTLMRLHYQDLFNYGTRFTKDEELVKDCIHDLSLALWKNRATINESSFVKYYLLKSLRRQLAKALNKNKWPGFHKTLHFAAMEDTTPSIESRLIQQEQAAALAKSMRAILAGLSRRQQEVIYLRFYLDADIEEIAEIMSLNRQSIYNLLHDALKKLKQLTAAHHFSLSRFFSLFF